MKVLYIGLLFLVFGVISCKTKNISSTGNNHDFDTAFFISEAKGYLSQKPITITKFKAERSAGGKHDYFSEGPYWWPDTLNPSGPYIRKDGIRNPNMFNGHRSVLKDFGQQMIFLTAAFLETQNEKYSQKAVQHLNAWFVDTITMMNPNLLYAQAIKGINDGRGIGIIDAVGLIDIVNSIHILQDNNQIPQDKFLAISNWFTIFTEWLISSSHGIEEANNNNNHSTWWGAQVASYARLTGNKKHLEIAKIQFKKQLDIQMMDDGSFPDELRRTRPWHYMIYNLDAWAIYATLLSDKNENFWSFEGKTGNLEKAIDFAYPYFLNPDVWPYHTSLQKKVNPEASTFYYLASKPLNKPEYKSLWSKLSEGDGSKDPSLFLYQKLYGL